MVLRIWLLWLWALGGLSIVLGLFRPGVQIEYRRIIDKNEASWFSGGFRTHGTYTTTDGSFLASRGIRTAGSWLDNDQWTGSAETVWRSLSGSKLCLYVAGYPSLPGNELIAEFRQDAKEVVRVKCEMANPGEKWLPWNPVVPPGAEAVRVVAVDQATDFAGWVAFSEPIIWEEPFIHDIYMAAEVVTTLALCLILVWLPGIVLVSLKPGSKWRIPLLLGTGPLLLVACGSMVWALGGVWSSQIVSVVAVMGVWTGIGVFIWRGVPALNPNELRVLSVSALIALSCVAKASYSKGPQGELYGGTISRTLAVGDRSDAGIPFHIVQLIAHHVSPTTPASDRFFAPWTFFSRGPLSGIAAAPVVLATAGLPPAEWPFQPWEPFDTTGFAAYRITLITLASGVIVALFLVLAPMVGERWATLGAGLVALSPFGVHEIFFTWPKWSATVWLLTSFYFAHQRRGFFSGLAIGIGFLCHPLALLWIPWIGLWLLGRTERDIRAFTRTGLRFAIGCALLAVPWMTLGRIAPHIAESTLAGQGGFTHYFLLTDIYPRSVSGWLQSRATSFANTFIPFWLSLMQDKQHFAINAVAGQSIPEWERFDFSWWNTLPLGLGLFVWAGSLAAFVRGLKTELKIVGVLLIGPASALLLYWGPNATGLMRECAHPLFVSVVGYTSYRISRSAGSWLARGLSHPIFPWLQLPETLMMMWLSPLLNPVVFDNTSRVADRCYFMLSLTAIGLAAMTLSRTNANGASPLRDESSENSLTKSAKDQAEGFYPKLWFKTVRYHEPET